MAGLQAGADRPRASSFSTISRAALAPSTGANAVRSSPLRAGSTPVAQTLRPTPSLTSLNASSASAKSVFHSDRLAAAMESLERSSSSTGRADQRPGAGAFGAVDDTWQALIVRQLPLWNGQNVSFAIESFNELVSSWIATVVKRSKSHVVLDNLSTCVSDLLYTGMLTIDSHVRAVVDRGCTNDELLEVILDRFAFLLSDLLPYLEAILLPMRTDPKLLAIAARSRPSKTIGGPTGISIRSLTLIAFRDQIVLAHAERLEHLLRNGQPAPATHRRSAFGSGAAASAQSEGEANTARAAWAHRQARRTQLFGLLRALQTDDRAQHVLERMMALQLAAPASRRGSVDDTPVLPRRPRDSNPARGQPGLVSDDERLGGTGGHSSESSDGPVRW